MMGVSIQESASRCLATRFRFGKAHGRSRAELERAGAGDATSASRRREPPPASAGIISSIASHHHTISPVDTALQPIQKPAKAHLRGSGDSSIPVCSFHAAAEESLNECCAPRKKTSRSKRRMGLSKTKRILVLLAIDSAFFLLELVVGTLYHCDVQETSVS